jgi:hypothetical protein
VALGSIPRWPKTPATVVRAEAGDRGGMFDDGHDLDRGHPCAERDVDLEREVGLGAAEDGQPGNGREGPVAKAERWVLVDVTPDLLVDASRRAGRQSSKRSIDHVGDARGGFVHGVPTDGRRCGWFVDERHVWLLRLVANLDGSAQCFDVHAEATGADAGAIAAGTSADSISR